MKKVQVQELFFEKFISTEEIEAAVQKVADEINRDYDGKNPLLLAILNGSFIFASDLMRKLTIPCEISFVKFASYDGTLTTSKVKELIGVGEELSGRHIIIVEDIVDTGITCKSSSRISRKKIRSMSGSPAFALNRMPLRRISTSTIWA